MAQQAIKEEVVNALGIDVTSAALGIKVTIDTQMETYKQIIAANGVLTRRAVRVVEGFSGKRVTLPKLTSC